MQNQISMGNITIGKKFLKVGDERVFLNCGEMHYFRIKSEDWNERLSLAKQMGLNAISTYIPWNFHELREGKFDFTSPQRDIDQFFHLCENHGFYILVRPGPFIGESVINGGIPQWLIEEHPKVLIHDEDFQIPEAREKQKPPMSYSSQTYLKYVQRYIKALAPVLRKHLYPHGGVIMIQVDNELSFERHENIYDTDYNPLYIEQYKNFLREKYKSIKEVNRNYNTQFLDFFSIEPPSSNTYNYAISSMNDFQQIGEFLRLLDWMESKEYAIQEYARQICYFFRKAGLWIPYYVNIHSDISPNNYRILYNAYKTKVFVGQNLHRSNTCDQINQCFNIGLRLEYFKAQIPHMVFIPEMEIGSKNIITHNKRTSLILRLALAHGMKALNCYMAVGGVNPSDEYKGKKFSYAGYNKTVGYNGKQFFIDDTGVSYDYNAPIGEKGQINPRYDVLRDFGKYIDLNEQKLLNSEKIYDPIAYFYYHPYTRMKFNTKKLGTKIDYSNIVNDLSRSKFITIQTIIHDLNIHPSVIDLEECSVNELLDKKIIMGYFCNFLSREAMQKLKKFVEKGGTLISFVDIPLTNEILRTEYTLMEIYRAKINASEYVDSVQFLNKEIKNSGLLVSFKFLKKDVPVSQSYDESAFNEDGIDDEDIIASINSKDKKKIVGFHRKYEKGHIYHFGFDITPDSDSSILDIMRTFLENIGLNVITTECEDKLTIIRRRLVNSHEEFVTVANLTNKPIRNKQIVFNDTNKDNNPKDSSLRIEDIVVPAESALQWTKDKIIHKGITCRICTSEINKIKTHSRKTPIQHEVAGFHYEGSSNYLELIFDTKPITIVFNSKDITKKLRKKKSKLPIFLEEQKDEKRYKLQVRYSETIDMKIELGEKDNIKEIFNLNLMQRKKKNN
ncbi:MAG: hypothetical protein GF364_21910 [Candidatus Lokiarchaeota archaeon]|nr:hypothetical protein [Candidatus Lokiarchaeota archaeon]